MNEQTDSQLLRAYAGKHSETAFAELVRRHVDFVYSAALRMVCDAHLAKDVTQGVFLACAKNADALAQYRVLGGWLHRTTQNIAAQTVRTDVRRREREQEATAMNEIFASQTEASWQQLAPHLDAALGELPETDREAVLLRYFERKSAREMAVLLGVSDEAAQKRVNRAVERLRDFFARRGIAIGATGLVAVISANAVQAAPTGMAASIAAAAFAGAAAITTSTMITQSTMSIFTWKTAAAVIAATAIVGTGTYYVQQGEINRLRNDNRSLAAARDSLRQENEKAVALAATNQNEIDRLRKNQNDLLHLRGEVGQLRHQLEAARTESAKQARPRSSAPIKAAHAPGAYIASDQLGNVGYATPEAAMETMIWAMMHSTYDDLAKSLSPKIRESEFKDNVSRANFEETQAKMAALLKGVQIVARKPLADGTVELKVKQDYDPDAVKQAGLPVPSTEYMLQPMINIDGEWKLGGPTHPYDNGWDNGDVLSYAQ